MSEVNPIEAVSKAIQDLLPEWMAEDGRVEDIDLARAALTALSENITASMWAAGSDAMGDTGDPGEVVRAMLNHVMKEKPNV